MDALLAALTVEEKAALTAGADMWTVAGLPAHGVPAITVTDGPNGARGAALLGAGRVSALCVPCGSALGATWDPGLVEQIGQVLGEEARTKGARVLLAPTVNVPRSPLFGRAFECYSEDPLLSGAAAAGFVRGVQSRGVAAAVKHFVANESEHERTTSSSRVEERALREIYLPPFEAAVREGGAMAVMTGYNRVNGTWCAEHVELVQRVLRDELGFTGVVMTDWFAVGSTVASALAGVDLQMPGPARFFGPHLAAAVRRGEVPLETLDASARRWLALIDALDAWQDGPVRERAIERPEHRVVARRAAVESTVLLRNDGTLPLRPGLRVALLGPNADRAHIMGGGSAQLRAHRMVTLAEVLHERLGAGLVAVEAGCVVDKTVRPLPGPVHVEFRRADGTVAGTTSERDGRLLWFTEPVAGLAEPYSFTARAVLRVRDEGKHRFTLTQAGRARLIVAGEVLIDGFTDVPPQGSDLFGLGSIEVEAFADLRAGQEVEVVVEYSTEGSAVLHGVKVGLQGPDTVDLLERAVAAAVEADVAVVVVGTSDEWETEGHDRSSLHLPGEQDELIRRVCSVNPRTVVVVNAGAPVQVDWADEAAAILVPWLGGQEMAEALADVLLGDAEPAGRLPVTFPCRIEHTPAYGTVPGANNEVAYAEGVLVGYRWYDTRALPVAFPFGAGGSYTTFSWGQPHISSDRMEPGGHLVVEVPVTNTGPRRGAEVVQLYVSAPPSRLFRPRQELRAFAKVWADPGETAVARLELDVRDFAFWDPGAPDTPLLLERLGDGRVVPADVGPVPVSVPGWYVEAGLHELRLSRSIDDVISTCTVELAWSGRLEPDALPSAEESRTDD